MISFPDGLVPYRYICLPRFSLARQPVCRSGERDAQQGDQRNPETGHGMSTPPLFRGDR